MSAPRPSAARVWIAAARPKTLTAAAAPVVVGSALAILHERFSWAVAAAALGVAFFIQIGTNFANDLFDHIKGADDAERLGPIRATAAGWVAPRQIALAVALSMGAALLCGLYLSWIAGPWLFALGIISIASGIAYTGGPFPLAYNALGDLFVFVFFGLVATVGTYYVHTLSLGPAPFWCAVPVGALATAILIVNNVRDAPNDRRHNKITTAVLLGPRRSRLFYTATLVVALFAPPAAAALGHLPWHAAAVLLAAPLAASSARGVWRRDGADLNPMLARTSLLLLLTSALLSGALIAARLSGGIAP